uniref:Uncharacterized protein n=1 Tax=Rhizophora mucronata TaxID=61149 RepID=A0A2P2MFU3_RHIMU
MKSHLNFLLSGNFVFFFKKNQSW